MITDKEARQALKTIAQYCDDVDCYKCEIKDACVAIDAQLSPFSFCRLSEAMRKDGGKTMIKAKEAETIKKIDAMFELDILKIWVDYCEGENDCSACKLGNACDKLGDAYATMINDLLLD